MAVQSIQKTQLRLVLEDDYDEFGKMQYRNKNYNNVKTSASADDLYSVALAIAGLQTKGIADIVRNDSHIIINE